MIFEIKVENDYYPKITIYYLEKFKYFRPNLERFNTSTVVPK